MGVTDPPRAEPTSGTERRPSPESNALTATVGTAGGIALLVFLLGAFFAAPWPAAAVAGGICAMGVAVAWLQTRGSGRR